MHKIRENQGFSVWMSVSYLLTHSHNKEKSDDEDDLYRLKKYVWHIRSFGFCFIQLHNTITMVATTFLEHDNTSFSRVLLSKEVAEIIKHVVKESSNPIHPNCNDRKDFFFKGEKNGS